MPPSIPTEVSLTLFGGRDESLVATDLPEGLSPANNDCTFAPGSVSSRPCLSKIFGVPFAGSPSVLWAKKYLQSDGTPRNLYLDALGVLRFEDPINNPGNYTTIQQLSTAVKTFKSVSFDGVEYMAFSDGIHGVDVPRFYDTYLGTFDRISKDGVGTTAMTVTDIISQVNVSSITLGDLGGGITAATEAGNSVTVTTTNPHGLTEVGGFILIYGANVAGYNGVYQINAIPTTTTFIVVNAGTGLAAANTGHVSLATPTVVTGTAHGLSVGDAVTLAGTGGGFDNGTNQTSNTPVPLFWDVVKIISATSFQFSLVTLRGQGSFNTTTIAASGAAGTAQSGGMGTIGTHQIAVSFLWRGGYITKPSPPVYFTSTGNKQWQVSAIPLGPTGVIARILHFTGSDGGNFYSIPANVTLPGNSLLFNGANAPSTIVNSTWILDNTTTSTIVDFPDNTLFGGLGADIPGNNLFDLVVLGPCLGFDAYAGRLMPWGAFNKVENFLNMGFEGGITSGSPNNPLGWGNVDNANGALVNAPNAFGLAWQISNIPGGSSLIAEIFSTGQGSLAKATIPIANLVTTGIGTFVNAAFSALTPAVIPADAFLRVYATGLVGLITQTAFQNYLFQPILQPNTQYSFYCMAKSNVAGTVITVDEMMVVFTNQPYKDRLFMPSYVNNPESFDGLTGQLGSAEDPHPIRDTFQIQEAFFFLTAKRLHVTRDAGVEPGAPNGGWTVTQREDNVGAPSIHAATTGTGWAAWLVDGGKFLSVRAFAGGDSGKISREMQVTFQAVNMAAKQTAWIQNVDEESKLYIGIPQGAAILPSIMPVLDYFYSDTAGEIIANRPLHIGFTGKMLTTDLGRKWTNWNLALNCGAILARAGGIDRFVVGGNFGNVYTFETTKLTDDDYGQMMPRYTTYFFVNHDLEVQMQLGSKLKLFGGEGAKPLTLFIIGVGKLVVTPLANTVSNKWTPVNALQPYVLSLNQADDIELPINVRARRCAVEISVVPAAGAVSPTDVQFTLSHLTMPLMRDPVTPTGGQNRSYQ